MEKEEADRKKAQTALKQKAALGGEDGFEQTTGRVKVDKQTRK